MNRLPAWLRDPLLHFAVLGTALYLILPQDADTSSRRISVSRADLVDFMQQKARLFDGRSFDQIYDSLSPADRRKVFDDYVRQEALYRQALGDGLDKADPLIRSRLVQQMELLLRDDTQADAAATAEEVERYYNQHRQEYAAPGAATFTHVFFDRRKPGAEQAARAALAQLQARRVAAEDALPYGDRFPYQRNYADASEALLTPEIGAAAAKGAFSAPVGQWAGPFESPLGWHVLLVARRTEPSVPDLAEIYPTVQRDAQVARRNVRGEQAIKRVLGDYTVVPAGNLGPM